jgi:hypothetical protein
MSNGTSGPYLQEKEVLHDGYEEGCQEAGQEGRQEDLEEEVRNFSSIVS